MREQNADKHAYVTRRIREQLFSQHTFEEFGFQKNSEQIIAPVTYLEETSHGGLSYSIQGRANNLLRVSIKHNKLDTFDFSIANEQANGTTFTMRSVLMTFDELPYRVLTFIEGCREEIQ